MKKQMRSGRALLAGIITLSLAIGSPMSAFAVAGGVPANGQGNGQGNEMDNILFELNVNDPSFQQEKQLMNDSVLLDDDILKENGNDQQKFTVRQQIEAKINVLEKQIAALEKRLKVMMKNGEKKQIEPIKEMIKEKNQQLKELKKQLLEFVDKAKEKNLSNYSEKELNYIEKIEAALAKTQRDLKIIPVENIVTDNGTIKLDMPMAIKNDIIYMPMAGFKQGLGAEIKYYKEYKKFIIKRDGVLIELFLDKNVIEVDGIPQKASAKPIVVGDKVLIPVNDIAKAMKVKFTYYRSTNTLMIETKAGEKAPVATTPVIPTTTIPSTDASTTTPSAVVTTP